MNLVQTTQGLMDLSRLEVKDVVEVGDNYRKIATEYRLGGELVRREVTVTALRPIETVAEQGVING